MPFLAAVSCSLYYVFLPPRKSFRVTSKRQIKQKIQALVVTKQDLQEKGAEGKLFWVQDQKDTRGGQNISWDIKFSNLSKFHDKGVHGVHHTGAQSQKGGPGAKGGEVEILWEDTTCLHILYEDEHSHFG